MLLLRRVPVVQRVASGQDRRRPARVGLSVLLCVEDEGGKVAGSDRIVVGRREGDGGLGQYGRDRDINRF